MEKRFDGIRCRALLMLLAAVLGTFPLLSTQSKYVWKEEIHIQLEINCSGASQDGASVEEEAGLLTEEEPQPAGDGMTEPGAAGPEGAPAENGASVPEKIPSAGEQSAPEEDSSPAVTVPVQGSIPAPAPLTQEAGTEPVPPEPAPPETSPAGNTAPTESTAPVENTALTEGTQPTEETTATADTPPTGDEAPAEG